MEINPSFQLISFYQKKRKIKLDLQSHKSLFYIKIKTTL